MTIGEIINRRRKQLKLTLDDVARAVGVAKSTVGKWESGFIESMRLDKVENLAKVLDLSIAQLMGWPDAEPMPKPSKPKLRSVARLEDSDITEAEDAELQNFIDFLLSKRGKDV